MKRFFAVGLLFSFGMLACAWTPPAGNDEDTTAASKADVSAEAAARATAIQAEAAARTAAVEAVQANVTAEANTRGHEDDQIRDDLEFETGLRETADSEMLVGFAAADDALQANIDSEEAARAAADALKLDFDGGNLTWYPQTMEASGHADSSVNGTYVFASLSLGRPRYSNGNYTLAYGSGMWAVGSYPMFQTTNEDDSLVPPSGGWTSGFSLSYEIPQAALMSALGAASSETVAANAAAVSAEASARAAADALKLDLAGGTMSGDIVMPQEVHVKFGDVGYMYLDPYNNVRISAPELHIPPIRFGDSLGINASSYTMTLIAPADIRFDAPAVALDSFSVGGAEITSWAGVGDYITPAQIGAASSTANLNTFSSGDATSGQVPTADGSGGIAWGDQSGGSGGGMNGTTLILDDLTYSNGLYFAYGDDWTYAAGYCGESNWWADAECFDDETNIYIYGNN